MKVSRIGFRIVVVVLLLSLTATVRSQEAGEGPGASRPGQRLPDGQGGEPRGQGGLRSPVVPAGVRVLRDRAYADDNDRDHALDLYLPGTTGKPLPLLIYIHGGAWAMGDKGAAMQRNAVQLTTQGYAVASINYRLSSKAIFPAQIQDCKAAVRWLRANAAQYNIDPEHFGTWGGSAGGHLAALTGTSGGSKEFEPIGGNNEISDRVQAVCDLYGPTDLLKMNEQSGGRGPIKHNDAKSPESHLIGGPIQENKAKAERANPMKYITRDCPPFLIMHGENDDMVPIGQSEILLEALKAQGVEATLKRMPKWGHGDPRFETGDSLKEIETFFDKHLKTAAAATKTDTVGRSMEARTESPIPPPNEIPNTPHLPPDGRGEGPGRPGAIRRSGPGPGVEFWIPEGVATVRAVVLQGGQRLPPNEEWRVFARKYSIAMATGPETLLRMAKATNHPEIENAPIVTIGVSAGGTAATETALHFSERVLAIIPIHGAMLAKGNDDFNANRRADTPGDIQTLDVEKLFKVPMAFTFDDADGFVSPVTIEGFFRYGRSKGAPWMFLISKGGNHGDSTEDFSKVLLPWLGAVIETRLPAVGHNAAARFTDLPESSGWLGDLRTLEIDAFDHFHGDKKIASWFPNEAAASAWKSHAMAATYSIPDQSPKEPSGLIADFEVFDKNNADTTTGKGWHINANFKEADQLSNNLRYFVVGPVPKIIEGCDWIRTMNGGKVTQPISADPPFDFTVTADCTVYIAHGDQEQGKVAWLSDWTDTQQMLNVSGGMLERTIPMKIYARKFLKGQKVTPGANSSQPRSHGLMYVTLVRPATGFTLQTDNKPSPAQIRALPPSGVSDERRPSRPGPHDGGPLRFPGVDASHRDLEYAVVDGKSLKLDLYVPDRASGPIPLVIYIHGGGWYGGSRKGMPDTKLILSHGYALASVDYRVSGEAIFPAAIQDCKAAVRWLRTNAGKYNLDPDHFAAWGTSAGGHLVALLGTSTGVKEFDVGDNLNVSSEVQAVCDWFGPTDFLQMNAQAKAGAGSVIDHDSSGSPESKFIGGTIQQNKEKCAKANPITYVSKDNPPFLIMHGDRDPAVPIGQSQLLEEAMKKAGVDATLVVVQGAGHGGPLFQRPENQERMLEFFDKHLRNGNGSK